MTAEWAKSHAYTAADPLQLPEQHVHEWVWCVDRDCRFKTCADCFAYGGDDDAYDGRVTPVGGWLLLAAFIGAVVAVIVWALWVRTA